MILAFARGQYETVNGTFVSSCQGNTDWRKGSHELGYQIKFWLDSVSLKTASREDGGDDTALAIQVTEKKTNEVTLMVVGHLGQKGVVWRRYCTEVCGNMELENEGWLYGMEENGEMTGDNMVYLYPDMFTAMVGRFVKGKMVMAREGRVAAVRCRNNMMEIKYAVVRSRKKDVFTYEGAKRSRMSSKPTLMDPYERRNIRIGQSGLGDHTGEGVFARRDLMEGEVIMFYGGIYVEDISYWDNMTVEQREDVHKNLLEYNDTYGIDVPPDYSDILRYRATLGHKINHSFLANVDFCFTFHPRHGCIRCIKTIRGVGKGDELFIDYDYEFGDDTPRWYMALHEEQFGPMEVKKESKNVEIMKKWLEENKKYNKIEKWLGNLNLF